MTQYESCNNQTNDALDAYQRAADLDPANVHIKARLQLLRSNQANGISTQHSAPAPQDVHPQHYQAANVAGPPGPQWGVPAPVPGPPNQAPAPRSDWNQRLAAIDPQAQQQAYDQREGLRGPPPPPLSQPPPRQPSPRQDPMRPYQDPHRQTPIRRPSPSPIVGHSTPSSYQGQPLPQPPPIQPQQGGQPTRISNPNYGAPNPMSTPPAGHGGPMPPPGRGNSPPPDIRPIMDDRVPSPNSGLPHFAGRNHQGFQPAPIMAGGPPGPNLTAALAAADASAPRDREERPPTAGYKRPPEDEDYKTSNKRPANGDNRGRLDEINHRRPSPERQDEPRHQRRSSSEMRREANQNYHPSEAAHHPPLAASQQPHPDQQQQQASSQSQSQAQSQSQPQSQPPQHLPPMSEASREPPRDNFEHPARKMEIDENYDDAGDDDKRTASANRTSPPRSGLINGQPKSEPQS